jgi:hypothetical protein
MSITTLTSAGQQTRPIERPRPLLSVMAWELRRFGANRLFWLQALGFFCLLLFLAWASRAPQQFFFGANGGISAFAAGTSAWGLLTNLPLALVLLGLLLPFATVDGVTRDLSRRTHELLMTTALPTWAYVWGRYLTCLLLSLGLAVLSLAAFLGMGWLLHLTVTDYTTPEALLARTAGSVWSVTVDQATALQLQASHQVSTMVNQMHGVTLRIVSATRPHEAAVAVDPSLEDAYLLATSGQAVRV